MTSAPSRFQRLWPGIRPDLEEVVERVHAYVTSEVVPVEERRGGSMHGMPETEREALQAGARTAGVFAPQVPVDLGGLGLNWADCTPVFEAAGYSLFGPLALNCAAPDEGNMHLLDQVADGDQRRRYLEPLVQGQARSAFAMTEPAPGAGSDPRALATRAVRSGAGWVINGSKWFTSGMRGASFVICMARTSGAPGDKGGATMFLIDADNPGMRIVRDLDTLDEGLYGGHSEVVFDDCAVDESAVLGEVDRGFDYAQVRLEPARLTHCMRWLGLARRAHDIAVARATERRLFGSPLADLGLAQQLLADSEIDLVTSRVLVSETAHRLDAFGSAPKEVSVTKTHVAEAVGRVVDRSLQLCGALGVSGDVLLARYLREVRPFRIYDGPSETHRWVIARHAIKDAQLWRSHAH